MITVFTTATCAYCAMVKRFFDSKQIQYEVVNLDENPDKRQELFQATGAMTVPITQNGDQFVIGWQPAKLMELTK